VDLVIGSPAFAIDMSDLDRAVRIGRTPGDHRRVSWPANPDQVQIDGDFVAGVFSGPKMAENLYSSRDRICGFPQQNDRK
jgi:hypothetical protein